MSTESYSAPVCITSPVRRSGTTLIQRLICSASNALIYGETCADDFSMLTNLTGTKEMTLNSHKDWRNQQLEAVLEGKVNEWIPDLMPEVDTYIEAYNKMAKTLMNSFSAFAEKRGRNVWGVKLPEWNPANLHAFQTKFPETKIVYLHRNLEDCVRSAKKIEMVQGSAELQRFCQTWKQYSDFAKTHLNSEQVLQFNYEDLVAEPARWIKALEEFTGAENIDPSVMKIKVNTYVGDRRLEEANQPYLNPSELTEEELGIIHSFV